MSKWSSAFRDSRWQKKRLEIMERDQWTCIACGSSGAGVTLNVHHAYYESCRAPWEYEDSVLYTMCDSCHANHHVRQKILSIAVLQCISMIGNKTPNIVEFLIGVADALCGPPRNHIETESYVLGFSAGFRGTDDIKVAQNTVDCFNALMDIDKGGEA